MTSGNFTSFPLSAILDRAADQRSDLPDIPALAASIAEVGLIHPPIITREGVIVAGKRRITACRSLGWTHIAVQFAEDLGETQLHLVELEENVKRVDLSWQDQAAAIAAYDRLRKKLDPGWTSAQTAKALHMDVSYVPKMLAVNKAVEAGDPLVLAAPKISTAIGVVQRKAERQRAAVLREIAAPAGAETPTPSAVKAAILNTSFLTWAETYSGPKFNLLHCDFPYGVDATKTGQSSAKELGGYNDEADTYFVLLEAFCQNLQRFTSETAHLIFWFSMDFYEQTRLELTKAGFFVSPFPLIWGKSDNKGMMPDFNRQPRRIYETAFFCTLGDPKIVRPVGNAIWSPVTKETHMSEKPLAVLEHFFRMVVDETTTMLDPTCGGGNAVRCARDLGADFSLGIELSPEYAERAEQNLKEKT